MKYLITGITGFAGPHLANLLHREGHDVYGLVRCSNGRENDIRDVINDNVYKDINFLYSDLRNFRTLNKIFKENYRLFTYHGRDMDTLAVYTKNVMSERIYSNIVEGKKFPTIITDLEVVKNAIQIFKNNTIDVDNSKNDFQRLAEVLRS